jgi:hypothetical protein
MIFNYFFEQKLIAHLIKCILLPYFGQVKISIKIEKLLHNLDIHFKVIDLTPTSTIAEQNLGHLSD